MRQLCRPLLAHVPPDPQPPHHVPVASATTMQHRALVRPRMSLEQSWAGGGAGLVAQTACGCCSCQECEQPRADSPKQGERSALVCAGVSFFWRTKHVPTLFGHLFGLCSLTKKSFGALKKLAPTFAT